MIQARQPQHINFAELARVIGYLLLGEALFMLVPLGVSLYYGDGDASAFMVTIIGTVVIAMGQIFIPKPVNRNLSKRDGLLLTSAIWVIFSLVGMIPFIITGSCVDVADAFFESMSGFTTTGASVIDDVNALPHGIIIWRCLMQWIGGVGIIIFTVALLPMLNSNGGMQMYNAELSGITHDKIKPRISQTAKRLWLIYTLLTVALTLLLHIGPMDFFESVCHAFSTVSTGGFSTNGAGLALWDSVYIDIVMTVFMFLGGVSFVMIYKASTGRVKEVARDPIMRVYVGVICVVTLLVVVTLIVEGLFSNVRNSIIHPLFQTVSLLTSTGYLVESAAAWPAFIVPVMMLLMLSGACAGSTSGGAKIDRFVYLWKYCRNQVRLVVHPNRYYPLTIGGSVKQPETVAKVISFLWLYLAIIILGGIILTATGMPMADAFFAAFSCIGNSGLGIGIASHSYAAVPMAAKIILPCLMLVGRLEIFTVLIIFTRGFWHR